MKVENIICTGCSLLCDDVDVELEGGIIAKTWGACSHGTNRLKGFRENRLKAPLINGTQVDVDKAIEFIAEKLKSAKNPVIYGGENSSNKVVELALKLAEKLNAIYDAPPSICRALLPLQEDIGVKGLSFDEVLNEADFILYWDVSVADTHLRHASKYAVMPRGTVIKMGRENRIVAMIDIRESMSMKIAQHKIVIDPCKDLELAKAINDVLEGRMPSALPELTRQIALLASDLKGASFTAIFVGSGLLRCKDSEGSIKAILSLAKKLCERGKCSVHPMAESVNSYGQAKIMLRTLGTCMPYNFEEKHASEPLHVLASREVADFVFAVNSDVLAQIPLKSAKKLKGKLACTTELKSITQANSIAVIPVQALGIEAGGVVTRTDGVDVELKPFVKTSEELISEEEVLSRLLASI